MGYRSLAGRYAELRLLAVPRFGLFTAGEAADCGIRRQSLSVAVRRGDVASVTHGDTRLAGVYRFAGVSDGWPAPVMAACLAVGGDAVACRDTALQLLGFRPADSETIHVCRPGRWQPTVPGIHVHTTRDLIDGDWDDSTGIRATTAARTVIDLAATLTKPERLALVDEMVFSGAVARQWLYRRAVALQNGRTGVLDIVRATGPGAEAEFRSWLERQASLAFRRFAVPQPNWNVPLDDAKGRIGIVDCLWPCGLVVEIEGLRFHTTPDQRRRDAARFNRLARRGPVLRYTWQDVVERPEQMCAEILDVLRGLETAVVASTGS